MTKYSTVAILKSLIVFKQGLAPIVFTLAPANYVGSSSLAPQLLYFTSSHLVFYAALPVIQMTPLQSCLLALPISRTRAPGGPETHELATTVSPAQGAGPGPVSDSAHGEIMTKQTSRNNSWSPKNTWMSAGLSSVASDSFAHTGLPANVRY